MYEYIYIYIYIINIYVQQTMKENVIRVNLLSGIHTTLSTSASLISVWRIQMVAFPLHWQMASFLKKCVVESTGEILSLWPSKQPRVLMVSAGLSLQPPIYNQLIFDVVLHFSSTAKLSPETIAKMYLF